ncbi:MAG: hypothetical protein HYZ36_05125, partial [Pedosphaera parvula]|nr:hypothetical protein [Pedosphaera parvula]
MRKLFDIHPGLISESALQRIYLDLAEDYLAHQIEPTWKDHPRLPRCGCWQSDYPVPPLPAFVARERPKEDDGKPGLAPRERLIERSLAAVRQKVFTHRLFAKEHGVSSDGTWGLDPNPREARKHGSSSFSFALCTAYELRHLLEDALWEQVREVAAFEADVCAQIEIRSGKYFDTAAEEAYPLNPLVLSAIFFGDHPHAAQWWDRVCDLEVSHLSAVQDHYDDRPIDGKPLRDRVLTENAHPDFTIENHGFLNPYYMHYFDPQIAYCKMAGRPIPRAFLWRRQQVWDWIKKNSGDDGFWMFPLGFDYYQHQYALLLRRISLMATVFGDPVAKLYECRAAQYLHQNWKRLGSPGCFYEPAGNGRDWELMCIAACYRLHQVFPSATWEALPPPDELLALRTGRTVFSYCRVVSHRTPEKYASFGFNHDLRIFTGNVVPQGG